jgi:hypothetical protein
VITAALLASVGGGISVAVCVVLGPATASRLCVDNIAQSHHFGTCFWSADIETWIKLSHPSRHRSQEGGAEYFDRLVPVGRLLWLGENLADRLEHYQSAHSSQSCQQCTYSLDSTFTQIRSGLSVYIFLGITGDSSRGVGSSITATFGTLFNNSIRCAWSDIGGLS